MDVSKIHLWHCCLACNRRLHFSGLVQYCSIQCKKLGKILTGLTYKLLSSFMVISDVYRSFTQNKTTFTEYFLTQWISKLPGSFEIHWVKQYLVNFMALVDIVNATVYKTESIFTGLGHGKLSQFITLIGLGHNSLSPVRTQNKISNVVNRFHFFIFMSVRPLWPAFFIC